MIDEVSNHGVSHVRRRLRRAPFVWTACAWLCVCRLFLFSGSAATAYLEAPELAEPVKAKRLPPVEERLPAVPLVVPTLESGRYGGTLRTGLRDGENHTWIWRLIGCEGLVRWDPNWQRLQPNLAASYSANDDATVFTFKLREGVRWSDGAPFTADDIVFWREVMVPIRLRTGLDNRWLNPGGKVLEVHKIDDYTVEFRFAVPFALFPNQLATTIGELVTRYPVHYLGRFHPKYNPDGIDAILQERGFDNWEDLMMEECGQTGGRNHLSLFRNPKLPTLHAWVMEQDFLHAPLSTARRNPYYWKIDTAGRQLPYIDRVEFIMHRSQAEYLDLVREGRIDLEEFVTMDPATQRQLKEWAAEGRLKTITIVPAIGNSTAIAFNLAHPDPDKRALYGEKKFRVALSVAINRQVIIDEAFGGNGEPWQVAPRQQSAFYDSEFAKEFTGYDPTRAEALLDEVEARRGEGGWRTLPNGKPLAVEILYHSKMNSTRALEMVRDQWQAVGVRTALRDVELSMFYQLKGSNLNDVVVWQGDGGIDVQTDPRFYLPFSFESNFATPWGHWYSGVGYLPNERPPAYDLESLALFDTLQKFPDPVEREPVMRRILDRARERFYAIGISLEPIGTRYYSPRLHNVPRVMIEGWTYPTPAPVNPCQFFLEP